MMNSCKSFCFSRLVTLAALLSIFSACNSCAGFYTNVAYTTPDESSGLKTRIYKRDVMSVRQFTRSIVAGFERWQITGERMCCNRDEQLLEPAGIWSEWPAGEMPGEVGAITVEITTRVFGFVDDMTIYLKPLGGDSTQVDVYSASRVGKGDLGVNARNIEKFLEALDERAESARAVQTATPEVE